MSGRVLGLLWPQPSEDADWRSWARRLVQTLEFRDINQVVQLATYSGTRLPKANQDGLLIFVVDDAGGAVPAFSYQGSWLRVTDRATISVNSSTTLTGSGLALTAGTVSVTV